MLGALTTEQIRNVLQTQVIGRIGCCVDNEMYIVPVTYALYENYIYAHSKEGLKVLMMRQNPHVCFQVDSIENMANWRSVILWGEYEELKTEKEQKAGLKIMVDRLVPYVTSEAIRPSHGLSNAPALVEKGLKAVVYRIKITKSSGRYEKSLLSEIGNYEYKLVK